VNSLAAGCGSLTHDQNPRISPTKFQEDEITVEDISVLLTIICEAFEVYATKGIPAS